MLLDSSGFLLNLSGRRIPNPVARSTSDGICRPASERTYDHNSGLFPQRSQLLPRSAYRSIPTISYRRTNMGTSDIYFLEIKSEIHGNILSPISKDPFIAPIGASSDQAFGGICVTADRAERDVCFGWLQLG